MLDPVTLTRNLIAFDTVNPPGREGACLDVVAAILGEAGFDCRIQDLGAGRCNLVASLCDPNAGRPPLGFTGHLDTVPLGDQPWTRDPFGGELVDGKLFGRGSSDMKGGVAAFVAAAVAQAEHLRRGPGVVLLITAGEETGSVGARALAEARLVPAMSGLVVAEPTSNQPFLGHKGVLWLELVVSGVTAHASMPEQGVNAIHRALPVLSALAAFRPDVPAHPALGAPTTNLGTVRAGININSVPDQAIIGFDMRSLPGMDHAALRAQVAALVGPEVMLRTLLDLPAVWTAPDDPFARTIQEVANAVTGETREPGGAPYFTDASVFTPFLGNVPTLILGPGEAAQAHQTDEYCLAHRIEEATEIYARLMRRI